MRCLSSVLAFLARSQLASEMLSFQFVSRALCKFRDWLALSFRLGSRNTPSHGVKPLIYLFQQSSINSKKIVYAPCC